MSRYLLSLLVALASALLLSCGGGRNDDDAQLPASPVIHERSR